MLQIESGTVLIGFTGEMKCPHCNNSTLMQVRQTYTKQNVFLIPIGTSHGVIDLVCPVCEKAKRLITSTLFSSQDKKSNLLDLLESGKEYTKEWAGRLGHKDRERVLKRLNSLKAYSLVRYIGA